ncbi:MAG: discoidin domain-containing protein [Opitutae bacterium]|nr:discoidin domain-containing protein [Opitutae bacterium]
MTSLASRFHRVAVQTLIGPTLLLLATPALAQPRVLDEGESLSGWQAAHSEGAQASIATVPGETGRALALEFDLSRSYGYATAHKDLALELPDNYQFTFDLRADSPVNNFEVKLVDDDNNVWWHRRLSVTFPKTWETQHLRRRHFTYAWGPSKKPEIRRIKAIEFTVASGTGGRGRVFIDNLRFEPIDDAAAKNARAFVATSQPEAPGRAPVADQSGTVVTGWTTAAPASGEWLAVNFGYLRELGALVLDWAPGAHATAYDVLLSSDGKKWTTAASITRGNGGRDYLYLPEQQGRWLKLVVRAPARTGQAASLARLEVKGPETGMSKNAFFSTVAHDQPRGTYPKYLLPEQNYWTVVGSPADMTEALVSETGAIEIDQGCFTIEPFLLVDGKLITWGDVSLKQSLEKNYLPIPSVEWQTSGLTLTTTAFAAGAAGPDSRLLATYRIASTGAPLKGRLFLAIRPFQVNPPWQSIFRPAGWARTERIALQDGVVRVSDHTIVPLDRPAGFGATPFEAGEITEHLQQGHVPADQSVEDASGSASAALVYEFDLAAGATQEFHLAVPFHGWSGAPRPNLPPDAAARYMGDAHDATRRTWESMVDLFQVKLPPAAQPVIDTIKSNLAYIFINQDGPRIQPGSRNYQRSWIRDGSLTSTALLELGLKDEVRAFADWFSGYQFPSGKVPCVVDANGADPTDEHDSHGQLIYLIMQVYHYTHDKAWLRTKWETVVKTVHFIQGLRAQRKTDLYLHGTPEQQACYGLVPESISHEGYGAKPMHSYWDDTFILRGLKDATTIAGILGEKQAEAEFAAERDDFAKDFYASINRAMKNLNIDFIPGCAELGDHDATSTTVALAPGYELGRLPQPALQRTFDRYYEKFLRRRDGPQDWYDLTPYENRVIGSFVLLGQKDRSTAVLDYFMGLRRPAAWNQWAEVVFPDPKTPKMIGDMPHTWCGSDFIRSVRLMFVYEREQDEALVLAAGIPDAWVTDPAGVEVLGLPTYYGNLDYTLKSRATATGTEVTATIGQGVTVPTGGVIMKSPLSRPIVAVSGDGHLVAPGSGEILIERLPAKLVITY